MDRGKYYIEIKEVDTFENFILRIWCSLSTSQLSFLQRFLSWEPKKNIFYYNQLGKTKFI